MQAIQKSQALPTGSSSPAGAAPCWGKTKAAPGRVYRRSRTVKSPRKRVQLLVLNKTSAERLVQLGCGTGGPGNNGPFIRRCCWGDDSNGFSVPLSSGGLVALLAGVGVAGALMQAGPASAESAAVLTEDAFAWLGGQEMIGSDSELFQTLSKGYTSSAFTEEEKDLVCPKQYRVREWVLVQ